MPKKLRIKRRKTGAAGPPSALANGEIAFSEISNILFYGKGGTDATAAQIIAIGGDGAYVAIDGNQLINGLKTFNGNVVFILSPVAPTPATSDNSNLLATTAFVKNQQYLTAASSFDAGVIVSAGALDTLILDELDGPLYTQNFSAIEIE
jgi:hypothetical protein